MTELDSLREAVEEATVAALDYGVGEQDVVDLTTRARQMRGRDGWVLAGLQRVFLDVAAQHRAECVLPGCRTCASIRYGLMSTLAQLRVLAEDAERLAARRLRMVA